MNDMEFFTLCGFGVLLVRGLYWVFFESDDVDGHGVKR